MDPLGPLFVRWRYLPRVAPWIARWVAASRPGQVELSAESLKPLISPVFDEYERLLGPNAFRSLFRRHGQLYVWESDAPSCTEKIGHALRDHHGVEAHWLQPEQIRQLEPGLAPIFQRGLYLPNNGQTLQPLTLVETIVELLRAEGGAVETGDAVDIKPFDGGAAVHLADGRQFEAETVVVAAGAWSARLSSRLGVTIPLETERGYHVMLPKDSELLRRPVMHADRGFIATPMDNGLRIAGTVEFAGIDAQPDYRRAKSLLSHARAMFPVLQSETLDYWMGCRPSIPDSVPVIGHCPNAKSVIFAFGHGHLGITGAAMTGRLVGELAAGEPTTAIDMTPYRPERFRESLSIRRRRQGLAPSAAVSLG